MRKLAILLVIICIFNNGHANNNPIHEINFEVSDTLATINYLNTKSNIVFILYENKQVTKSKADIISYKIQYHKIHKHDDSSLLLNYNKYPDIDSAIKKSPETITFSINENFIVNNKDQIVSSKYFKNLKKEDVINFFKKFEKIFLIDKNEIIMNDKIIVREVNLFYEMEM